MDIMKKKIYTIVFENYQGESFTEHFFQLKNALARFTTLLNESREKDEFEHHGNNFGFFDAAYNEYSTYISMTEGVMKDLFSDNMI